MPITHTTIATFADQPGVEINKAEWNAVHTNPDIADVTGLQAALDSKLATVSVDGVTVTGNGTPGNPLVAVGDGTGDVHGPASSTDNAIARYDATTGKIIQNSGATIDDSGNLTATNFSGSSSGTNTGDQNLSGYLLSSTAASTYVPLTRTVNAKALSANITLTPSDIGSPAGSGTSTGTNTGDQTSVTGNAGTATALQTPRNINGVAFDGTSNITVTAAAGTLTGATLAAGVTASSLTSVGTIATGVWQGTAIADSYISSAATWNAKQNAITFGTGVQTALGVNIGSAGAPLLFNGALGTPSSGVATNLTGTAAGLTAGTVTTNANLTGEVTSVGNAATLTNSAVIGKVLTGYTSGAGTVAATDTILQAVQKLNGNDGLKANIAGQVFTGAISATNLSGTNTGDQTTITGNAGSATILQTGRTIAITGDLAYTSPSFNGSGNVTAAGTLATVNANVGSFGSATQSAVPTVNAKGLITAISNTTITPAVGSITGLGTGVATALAVNVGSAGAPVVNGGALGTPSSGVATNLTGTAAGLTAGAVAVGGITGLGTNVATFLATPSSANLRSAMTDETGTGPAVFATAPSMSSITLAAGTATAGTAPSYMTAGTNLTVAVAGATEYDGKTKLFTPISTERGAIESAQTFILNAGLAGANVTTAQDFLGVGVSVSSNTYYKFEGSFHISKSAGAVSHTVGILFGGTATLNFIGYDGTASFSVSAFNAGLGNPFNFYQQAATSYVALAASAAATQFYNIYVRGIVSVNAGGTFRPQYILSAAPGGAYTTSALSNFKIAPIAASGANVNIGTWA